MARPVTRRPSVRVGVQPVSQAPALDTPAPLNVRAPGTVGSSTLDSLLGALGVAQTAARVHKESKDAHDFQQGAADAPCCKRLRSPSPSTPA